MFLDRSWPIRGGAADICGCCCLNIKNRSDLCSVPSNIRTGPTDANAFPWSQANYPKRVHMMKTQREIKDPEKSTQTR